MPDLRQRVEEDRGLIKKIQSVIPGYAGYRRREDIRAADSLLRIQMADRLGGVRTEVEKCRRALVERMATEQLDAIGHLINKLKSVEGGVRHAEGGYSGISATIRIEEPELNQLYEYDLSLVNAILNLEQGLAPLRSAVDAGSGPQIRSEVDGLRTKVDELESAFKARIKRITVTEVV